MCIWLLHLFLLHGKNSIASKCPSTNSDLRSSRKLEENTEDKTEAMLDISAKPQTTENTSQTTISTTVLSCNCRKYCPAVNSTKLDVSYRRLFSYMLMCEVIYWGNPIWVAVELYFLGQNVRQDKRVNNLNLVASTFRHFETVEKSLSEKVSSGLQKILDHEWSSFFPRSHARRGKK